MARKDMVRVKSVYKGKDQSSVVGSVDGLVFIAEVLFRPSPEGIPTPVFPDGSNVVQLTITKSGRPVYKFANGEEWHTEDFDFTLAIAVLLEMQMRYCEGYEDTVMAMLAAE